MHILVVAQDVRTSALIRRGLRDDGGHADLETSAEAALERVQSGRYDAVVIDSDLTTRDGLDVCRELRERDDWSPVIVLVGRTAVADRLASLDSGADDYVVKPFTFSDLHGKLAGLGRRGHLQRSRVRTVGDLHLDPVGGRVWRGDVDVELSRREFALLESFMLHPGQMLSRHQLLDYAWDYDFENRSNVVDVYVRYLREKIDRPFGLRSIETVRGVGYRLRADGGRPLTRQSPAG